MSVSTPCEVDALPGPDAAPSGGVARLVVGLPARAERGPGTPGVLSSFLTADGPGAYRWAFYGFAAVAVTIFLVLASQGPVLQLAFGHDSIAFLNIAWRVHGGQLPNVDFPLALGALNPWLYAAGMRLLGPTAAVIPFCNAACALVTGLLAWVVAKPRLPAFGAAFFAFTQTVVAAAPHEMRWEWTSASYTCCYNRLGSALVATLLLLFLLPTRRAMTRRDACRDGGIAGVILGALLFWKISYFAVGGGLVVLPVLCGHRFPRELWWSLLAGFGAAMLGCLPLIGFDVAAMLRDLHLPVLARAANPNASFTPAHLLAWLPDAWMEIALLAVLQGAVAPGRAAGWLELAAVVAANVFISATNNPDGVRSETPVLTSWLFVLSGYALTRPPPAARPARISLPVLGGLTLVLWVYTFGTGFASMCWSAARWPTPWRQAALAASPPFDADSLADLRMPGRAGEGPGPGTYTQKINDGLRLLRKLGGVHRVEDFDFVNPFPFAMQWPAARGAFWCWHVGITFSEAAHPTPEQAFGDADILMVPKFAGEPSSFEAMRKIYGDYVVAHFRCIDESSQWYMLHRK